MHLIPINKQPPLKSSISDGQNLLVNSIFHTIQGEGPFAGSPSVFVRLTGCNLQCPACDTEYSVGQLMPIYEILCDIGQAFGAKTLPNRRPLVVITGGEPFRQNIGPLIEHLISSGFKVQIETNGTLFINIGWMLISPWLTIVCSPKAGKINKELAQHIHAFKYVLHADSVDPNDGLPILALDHTAAPRVARPPQGFTGDIYIQPIDVQDLAENDRHMKAAVSSALEHGYRLCLQIHKIIGVV